MVIHILSRRQWHIPKNIGGNEFIIVDAANDKYFNSNLFYYCKPTCDRTKGTIFAIIENGVFMKQTDLNKATLLGVLTILCVVFIFVLKPIPQSPSYHNFADTRKLWLINNFANVISNAPFFITGIIGLILVQKSRATKNIRTIYTSLFIGVLLTALGSAYYHYVPNNNTLVYDRIPMAIVFMALLSATIAELINAKLGLALLFPLIIVGIGSVLWWHFTEIKGSGDLRLYGFVQFYPVVAIPIILTLYRPTQHQTGLKQLVFVVLWYLMAKLLEYFDWQIYTMTHIVSGHTLKHLAAAMSTYYLLMLLSINILFTLMRGVQMNDRARFT